MVHLQRIPIKPIILVLCVILFAIFLYFYFSMVLPFILALLTALVLEPLVRGVQTYLKIPKRLPSVTIVFTCFIVLIAFILYMTVTRLVHQIMLFANRLPAFITEVRVFIDQSIANIYAVIQDLPDSYLIISELERQGQILVDKTQSVIKQILPMLTSWVQGISSFVVVTLIYLIALYMISLDLPRLKSMFYHFFTDENANKLRYVFARVGKVFTGFFKAQLFISLIVFTIAYVWLLVIRVDHALLIALIIWVIDLIPLIGSIIVLAPWAAYHLVVGDSALGVKLLVLAAIILILRRTLEPKIMGEQMGLSPLSTLIALYFGVYIFGVIGLIIGPLVAIAIKAALEAKIIRLNIKI